MTQPNTFFAVNRFDALDEAGKTKAHVVRLDVHAPIDEVGDVVNPKPSLSIIWTADGPKSKKDGKTKPVWGRPQITTPGASTLRDMNAAYIYSRKVFGHSRAAIDTAEAKFLTPFDAIVNIAKGRSVRVATDPRVGRMVHTSALLPSDEDSFGVVVAPGTPADIVKALAGITVTAKSAPEAEGKVMMRLVEMKADAALVAWITSGKKTESVTPEGDAPEVLSINALILGRSAADYKAPAEAASKK